VTPAPLWVPLLVLALVAAQRISELYLAMRNTRALLARGGVEVGAGHYPAIVAVHSLWLAALLWWVFTHETVVSWPLLAVYLALQPLRWWVIRTLGSYWTTRIITVPGAPLITGGPFRFVRHPNYIVVALEIAVLPLAFGAWPLTLAFSLANAAVLAVRLRAEETALAPRR